MSIEPQQKYLQVQVQTATPEMLVTMLYDGCIRFLRQGKAALNANNFQKANESIIRAQDILLELNSCLDMEQGGEIARNLRLLYDYMHQRLITANTKKDVAAVDEVTDFVTQIRDAWVEAVRAVNGSLRKNDTFAKI
ncbi:MAG: flagellar export chaperone FliS [Syntrophothermus sp.]